MKRESLFLIVAALGLTPIALAYGAMPDTTLPLLYGVDVDNISMRHILRAVMGLYLAMVVFWLMGAKREELTIPALWSVAVFMLGLAAGRAISLIVDGVPAPLLAIYLVLEIGFGFVSLYLIKNIKPA